MRTGDGSQEASVGLVPNLGSSSRRGQRTFRKAYPTSGLGCPVIRQAGPLDPRSARRQSPNNPHGSGALKLRRDGPSHAGDRGTRGSGPTPPGRDLCLVELAQPRSYLCSLTPAVQPARSPVPAAPQLPAALIEIQPEPLASAAPAATGPAQATAATPLTTASTTPPSKSLPMFIG